MTRANGCLKVLVRTVSAQHMCGGSGIRTPCCFNNHTFVSECGLCWLFESDRYDSHGLSLQLLLQGHEADSEMLHLRPYRVHSIMCKIVWNKEHFVNYCNYAYNLNRQHDVADLNVCYIFKYIVSQHLLLTDHALTLLTTQAISDRGPAV